MSNKQDTSKSGTYFLLTILIALTSFEYFFREGRILSLFMVIVIIIAILKNLKYRPNTIAATLLAVLIIYSCLHFALKEDNSSIFISSIITIIGTWIIALMCADNFIYCYIRIIFTIACTSLLIWILCFIPDIKDYIVFRLSPHFPSLNAKIAVVEGGGLNIIIYNIPTLWIDELYGIQRNSGPFWEPGMFAVYLIVGLFFYNFSPEPVENRIKGFNLVLIASLISTMSTGGIICGLLLLCLYLFSQKSTVKKIVLLPILAGLITAVFNIDFVGTKTIEQLTNSEIGSDASRFGAMKTQFQMFVNSPLIGGEKISDYTSGRTLASGTFLPFVYYGAIGGSLFFIIMMISYKKLYKNHCKINGAYLFAIILMLSTSQTILTMPFFICLVYAGLYRTNNYSLQSLVPSIS